MLERFDLDFNRELRELLARRNHGFVEIQLVVIPDLAMVVLHQDAIVHAHAVVRAAAAGDSVLLEDAQTRRGLAGVEDERTVLLRRVNKLLRERRRRTEALHEIESRALGRQNRTGLATEREDRFLRFDDGPVGLENRDLDLRVNHLHHGLRDRRARDDATRALRVNLTRGNRLGIDECFTRGITPFRLARVGNVGKIFVKGKPHRGLGPGREHHVFHGESSLSRHQEQPVEQHDQSQ